MSWFCIPSISLQEQAGESSGICSLDTLQSALSKSKNIPEEFCCKDSLTAFYQRFPFGTTFDPSGKTIKSAPHSSNEQRRCKGNSSSVAGSHNCAKTFPPPERVQESRASDPAFGQKWLALSVRFDPDSRWWKTAHSLFPEDSIACSPTLPRWGMMRDGELWERTTPGLRTEETGSGFWPTPIRDDANHRTNPAMAAHGMWPTPNRMDAVESELMSDPNHWRKRQAQKAEEGINLQFPLRVAVRMWPTPRAFMHKDASYDRGKSNLGDVVAELERFPTPKSRDWKGQIQRGIHGPADSVANLDRGDGKTIGGQLNPDWVEWLMGWPVGWTDLKPLETDRFLLWCASHGIR